MEPIRVDNAVPIIVGRKTHDKVQEVLKSRSIQIIHPRRLTSQYLFSGLLLCGHCRKALKGQDAKSGKFSYYICGTLNKQGSGSCPAKYLNSTSFEKPVIDKVKANILTPENLEQLVNLVNEEMDAQAVNYHDELETISTELAETNNRLSRLYEAIETCEFDYKDLAPRLKELRARQEILQQRQAQVELNLARRKIKPASPKRVDTNVTDKYNLLNRSSITERKSFIKSFIKEIKVTGKDVLLTYTLPVLPDGTSEERIGVLASGQYGGRYWIRTSGPCDVNAVL